ncbi:MAG: hypothetical protein AAF518_28825 [Spirochaetota bacterium]
MLLFLALFSLLAVPLPSLEQGFSKEQWHKLWPGVSLRFPLRMKTFQKSNIIKWQAKRSIHNTPGNSRGNESYQLQRDRKIEGKDHWEFVSLDGTLYLSIRKFAKPWQTKDLQPTADSFFRKSSTKKQQHWTRVYQVGDNNIRSHFFVFAREKAGFYWVWVSFPESSNELQKYFEEVRFLRMDANNENS